MPNTKKEEFNIINVIDGKCWTTLIVHYLTIKEFPSYMVVVKKIRSLVAKYTMVR